MFRLMTLYLFVILGVSTSALQALLEPIGATITCPLCVASLQRRVTEVLYQWSAVKVSSSPTICRPRTHS